MERKAHWEGVYRAKSPHEVSWYKEHLSLSLQFIRSSGADTAASVIDVGGGASTLVDDLLAQGFRHLTVLDVSQAALLAARKRLGPRAEDVTWIEADVTMAELPEGFYDIWHDRAVFHFLTEKSERRRYVEVLMRSLKAGGHLILAAFALQGPPRCSGLDVVRYSTGTLHEELGNAFVLRESVHETHVTPAGKEQQFLYCRYRKV